MTTTDDSKSAVADKLSLSEKVIKKAKEEATTKELIKLIIAEEKKDAITIYPAEFINNSAERLYQRIIKPLVEEIERLKEKIEVGLEYHNRDIRRIADLEKENQKLKDKVKFLLKVCIDGIEDEGEDEEFSEISKSLRESGEKK